MSTEKDNSTSEELKAMESGDEDVKSDYKPDDRAAETPTKGKDKEASKKKSKPKREPKSESEENDENDEKEDSEEKGVPLLDQPLELQGTRERKKVTRFSEEFKSEPKEAANIEIPEGQGTPLGDIPIIEGNIQRYKADDLKALHRVLFNRIGKATLLKKNIRKFNGFDFDEKSDQYPKKKQVLQKCEAKVLNGMCFILDLKRGTKQDTVDRILEFLMKPADSGKPLPKKRSKRSSVKSNKSYSESEEEGGSGEKRRSNRSKGKRKSLKEVDFSDEDMDAEDDEEEKKSKKKVKGGKKKKESRKDSENEKDNDVDAEENNAENDDENEENNKEEDEPMSGDDSDDGKKGKKGGKPNNKKATPKKEALKKPTPKKAEKKTAKKRSSNSDDESSEDEPLVKKNKAPPTDDEIRNFVKDILDGANLEETTMKTVCKQVYANYPEFDLSYKKDFIKTTVKSLISTT